VRYRNVDVHSRDWQHRPPEAPERSLKAVPRPRDGPKPSREPAATSREAHLPARVPPPYLPAFPEEDR